MRAGDQTPFAGELRRWRQRRRLTTQRHLSFVEHGRSRAGRTLVVRLAEALELTLRERNTLLLAAGFAPLFAGSPLDDEALRPAREALEHIVEGHMPYPAIVVRPYGELVVANAALSIVTEGAAPELVHPPLNVLRLAVHPAGMAPRVANLAQWGRHITESLRAQRCATQTRGSTPS